MCLFVLEKYVLRYLVFLVLVVLLNGCTAVKAAVAMNRSTDHFQVLNNDSRVRYEAGAEASARIIARDLDKAIAVIEAKQFTAFSKPVRVFLPATVDSFSSFCASARAAGCVLNERLFISPKKQNTPERIPGILGHELSHLHMEQYLGMWRWNSRIPSWFREGLAVYASGGGGAESVTEEMAIKAIASGKIFTPNASGSLLSPKTANTFDIKPHMFYRQSALFIQWLEEQNKSGFEILLSNIRTGKTLEEAMLGAYGGGLSEKWRNFVDEQQS